MKRRLITLTGSIEFVVMQSGLPLRLTEPAQSVSIVDDKLALVVVSAEFGEDNLLVLNNSSEVIARVGTTCGSGTVDQILEVDGEIRAVEATPNGDFQARLDLKSFDLERIGIWR